MKEFDLIRNSIDTYKTFYKRGYNELDSVPSNLLPILGDNLGWEFINANVLVEQGAPVYYYYMQKRK